MNKAICERVRESDESTEYYAIVIVIAAQSQLARENALKISGQLVVRKEKERKKGKREKKRERNEDKNEILGICQRSLWHD